ncbi:MAG: carboxylate--amine ligase [Legionella sp. 40-6]|nr:MAG: carboxylate--amine ligase [Legionella sp. 40-6]
MNAQNNKSLTSLSHKLPAPKNDSELVFNNSAALTLGVEVEMQLIDADDLNLCPRAEEVLQVTTHLDKVKREFYLSTLEISTGKCNSTQEVEDDLYHTFSQLINATEDLGLLFSTTGSHPFAKYSDWIISPNTPYRDIIDRNQWLTRRMSVYGLHVHLGMANGEECIRFNNFFMHFLPHLLALSASSPFSQGFDTGLSSCRSTTLEALPTAGLPYSVQTWQDFENLYKHLKLCDSIKSTKDLWWDLRPNPCFGTLEIRVCDGTATLAETLAIVALIHTLAHWFAENGSWLETVSYPTYWLARENKWRAMRYGLDAELIASPEGKTRYMREELEEWFVTLNPYIKKLGYESYFNTLQAIIDSGTSTERQLNVYAQSHNLEDVVKHNASEFLLQVPLYRYENIVP